MVWNKKKTKLGRPESPYGISTERILILGRRDDDLISHDGSDRCEILDFKPIQPRVGQQILRYEKPEAMMKLFVGKHTHPGEIVVEPFGGSGSACRAAAAMGRRWVYIESNEHAYAIGSARIAASLVLHREHAA